MESQRVINIVANDDYVPDYNFGYPCILHGVEAILDKLYGESGYHLTIYSHSDFRKKIIRDYSSTIKYIDSNPKKLLCIAILKRLGIKVRDDKWSKIIDEIMEADLVVGLYPISFCSSFNLNKRANRLYALKMVAGQNLLLVIGKIFGKPVVKTVCSVGPFTKRTDALGAKLAVRYLWDKVYVREKRSAEELMVYATKNKKPVISPDLANIMRYQKKEYLSCRPIGISVSFQIINQWNGTENYLVCIIELCNYILNHFDNPILLIPNEYTPILKYSDIDVAQSIYSRIMEGNKEAKVSILDIKNMTCQELKNEIASCEVLVASRYHSCVAGLSAGVPTLVIGWQWKYEELLTLYGQEEWVLPTELCGKDILITKFTDFWRNRKAIKKELIETGINVYKECFEKGKEMFQI